MGGVQSMEAGGKCIEEQQSRPPCIDYINFSVVTIRIIYFIAIFLNRHYSIALRNELTIWCLINLVKPLPSLLMRYNLSKDGYIIWLPEVFQEKIIRIKARNRCRVGDFTLVPSDSYKYDFDHHLIL
jgi:hypothetical protein